MSNDYPNYPGDWDSDQREMMYNLLEVLNVWAAERDDLEEEHHYNMCIQSLLQLAAIYGESCGAKMDKAIEEFKRAWEQAKETVGAYRNKANAEEQD